MLPPAVTRSYRSRAEPSELPEKMDGETSFETFRDTLSSLAAVNRLSFGYRPVLAFLRAARRRRPAKADWRVLDLGSGYGDTLRVAAAAMDRLGMRGTLIGIDINPHAAEAARAATRDAREGIDLHWVTADALDYTETAEKPDLIISSLFFHHLESADIPRFMRWMDRNAAEGWLVNDLYRSRLAAGGFALLARMLGTHPYVQHDGPVSFARSFRRDDWQRILAEAEIEGADLKIGAPFRLCVEKHA